MRLFQLACAALMLSLAVILTAADVPRKTPPGAPQKEKGKAVELDLTGQTTWGMLTQKGRVVEFTGHQQWVGFGLIREDGKLQLTWVQTADGRPAVGVYNVVMNGEGGLILDGHWGFIDSASVDENGELVGACSAERIWRKQEAK